MLVTATLIPRDQAAARRFFFVTVALTLSFRFVLAVITPIVGDEAYFYSWAQHPDWGFYDHPPMVGWWLAALSPLSSAEWVLRLPAVLLPTVLALGVAWTLRAWDGVNPWLGATAVALAPANVWNMVITTDTPLVLFSFLSGLAYLRAVRNDDPRFYAFAGVLLGLAFLSKYFAALVGIAYLAHALWRPTPRRLVGLGLLVAASLPFVALNLWWNWEHCWVNALFNLFNRNEEAVLSWRTPALYVAILLYLFSPLLPFALWRRRGALRVLANEPRGPALLCLAGAPLLLFALLSLVRDVGLHWLLAFVPFVFLLAARVLDDRAIKRINGFLAILALLHVGIAVTIALLPLETWRKMDFYDSLVQTIEVKRLEAALLPYAPEFEFATTSYSSAATLSYLTHRYYLVFGEGSYHARQDDIVTDLRRLDGRNILLLLLSSPAPAEYAPYFRVVETQRVELRGVVFYMVLGRGFNYSTYRERVLTRVRDRFYRLPRWLPVGGCYFCERYFPGAPLAPR